MKKVKLNFKFKSLSGKDMNVRDATTGKIEEMRPANILVADRLYRDISVKRGATIKNFEFAQLLYKNGYLILDTSDFEKLEKKIDTFKLENYMKYPILMAFKNAVEVDKSGKEIIKNESK